MKKVIAIMLVSMMALSIIGCSLSSDGDHINTQKVPGMKNDSVAQTGDKGDIEDNNDVYVPQGREGEFLYAQPAVMYGDWIDGKQTFQGVYAVSLIFIGDTFEHFRPPVIDDFAIFINEERQSYTIQDLHIHVEKLSELPAELYGHIPNDEDLVSIYNYRFGHDHEYEQLRGPGKYWFEATLDGVKIRSNTFVIHEDGTGGHLDDMPATASPLKLTLKSPSGEFLYAQVGLSFIMENDIIYLDAVKSVHLIFTGPAYERCLPPIINDFTLYVNDTQRIVPLHAPYASGINLAYPSLDEYLYVPRDEDTVTAYIAEFGYTNNITEPGEFWFEATVEGVRVRSNTFVWHTDGSFEYRDDMPAPSSPLKLRSRSSILPAESISIDPNERGYNLGYPVAVDKGDWVYYLADRNLHRMRAGGTGIETINIGFEVYAFNVIGDWIYTQLNVNWERGLYRFRTDGSDLTFIMDANEWGGGGGIYIVGEWLYYSSYGIGFNRVRTADGSEHTKINEDDIWVTQIGNEWFYYMPPDMGALGNRIIRGSTDGTREEDIVFTQFDTVGNLQLVGDWLYFTGTNQQIYQSLYKYHVDTKEIVQIINEDCQKYIVSSDWIYYTLGWSAGDEGFYVLRRIKTDGTGDTQIGRETGTFHFNVAGDWIFFYESVENEGEIVYRMRTDGSGDIIRVGRYH